MEHDPIYMAASVGLAVVHSVNSVVRDLDDNVTDLSNTRLNAQSNR